LSNLIASSPLCSSMEVISILPFRSMSSNIFSKSAFFPYIII
jgi:hypothetical protein